MESLDALFSKLSLLGNIQDDDRLSQNQIETAYQAMLVVCDFALSSNELFGILSNRKNEFKQILRLLKPESVEQHKNLYDVLKRFVEAIESYDKRLMTSLKGDLSVQVNNNN